MLDLHFVERYARVQDMYSNCATELCRIFSKTILTQYAYRVG